MGWHKSRSCRKYELCNYLYIKTLNEKQFVADFIGEAIENCVEKRAASSIEEEKKCEVMPSEFLPEARVFREGKSQIYINVALKDFLNNR